MHPECNQQACSISIEKGQSGMIPCLNYAQSLGQFLENASARLLAKQIPW